MGMAVYKKNISAPTNYSMGAARTEEGQECIDLLNEMCMHMSKLGMDNYNHKSWFHYKGYQGFKRMHRYSAREYWEFSSEIDCFLVDHYGVMPENTDVPDYRPPSENSVLGRLEEYLYLLEVVCERACEVKSILMVKDNGHFASELIQRMICSLEKSIKYVCRHIQYVKDVKENPADIHWYSHELHECFKEKEERKHNRHYK